MKKTFFDYLGIADMEKIHSQIFQWILSNDNDSFSLEQKSKFISDFLSVDNFVVKDVITEYKNIDILIISDDGVICIENKLKSSQHSNQLAKYEKIIENDEELKKITKDPRFFFLTLINEKPSSENKEWENISYQKLLVSLLKIKGSKKNAVPNEYILDEYIGTLKNITSVADAFIENPTSFRSVFDNGSKTKKDKITDTQNFKQLSLEEKYISENQLETIFQKMYFQKVADKLALNHFFDNVYITETRGNAVLGGHFIREVEISGVYFDFGFDYQNGTFKTMCVASDYIKSKKEDMPTLVKDIFKQIAGKSEFGYKKKPNEPKTKAQYSITKNGKDCIALSIDCFSQRFKEEMENAKKIVNEILDQLKA